MSLSIPHLSIEAIREAAEDVLSAHQPGGGIPVEVEEIIEFGLGMEIRPIKALQARFGFEGALTHDLRTIIVDEDHMVRYANRYRVTLAHELGHHVLHGDIIAAMIFEDKPGWKEAVSSIDPGAYGRLEHHAYVFAGHLLVPSAPLLASCQEAQTLALQHGIDLTEMGTSAISYVAGRIAREYRVSTAVMERRIAAERIFSAE